MVRFLREFGSRRRRVLDRQHMSPAVREAVEREERNGARYANRFRHLFVLLLAVPLLWNAIAYGGAGALMINAGTLALYFSITLSHSIVLARAPAGLRRVYDYIVLAADFLLILTTTLSWTYLISPDNFAFALKHSALIYLLIPLALAVIQFRQRLIFSALGCFGLAFGALLLYALGEPIQWTNDWRAYINGPGVVFSDLFTLPAVFVCVGLALAYVDYRALSMAVRIGRVEAQKVRLARYFAPQVVAEITAESGQAAGEETVRGRRQQVTVLFSDVRGFTALSEKLDPDELVATLGQLRRRQTRVIFEHGGTLDKFIGDAVMATFGTPRPGAEPGRDAKNAVLCGQALLRSLDQWNQERRAAGLAALRIGVGLHTGEVFVGDVGFEDRLEYTVIGDAVNTAARIESLCKTFDWPFLISDAVHGAIDAVLPAERLPDARVAGKAEPLVCYRVLWET